MWIIIMAQHFVTVCVVCVLCAAHNYPCSAHMDFSSSQSSKLFNDETNNNNNNNNNYYHLSNDEKLLNPSSSSSSSLLDNENSRDSDNDDDFYYLESINVPNEKKIVDTTNNKKLMEKRISRQESFRSRRHLDIDGKLFTKKVFETYGNGENMTMKGFEELLNKLGLVKLIMELNDERGETNSAGSVTELKKITEPSSDSDKRCVSSKELLSSLSQDVSYNSATNNNTVLPGWLFERVCPVLLYHLAGETNSERNGCIQIPEFYKPSAVESYESEEMARNMFQVWIYSAISILIISLCGLLGVAVIPVMGKSYYNQLLQFLVALAVGTLCGDALIHLLPHAMMSDAAHSHGNSHGHEELIIDHEADHNANMWKGLVAMLGLVLFFFTEKSLTMLAEWRKYRQRRNKLPPRVRVMRETEGPNSNTVGEKLCKHKYSSYPYCYGEITTETQDNHHHRHNNHHDRPAAIEEEKPLTSNCNSVLPSIVKNDLEKIVNDDWKLDETMKKIDGTNEVLNEAESYTVIIREHENKHHGHTHSHGHVHSAPESMSSVAWMVVMGDGLHNFTDGMAIGAAFSASIAGGFSTAIAVFCHELPHELGDFAVLLKAGMSAKQAVFYNLLSSVLCLFGMVFGVLLGATPAASSWVFAAAAGMFIYIALVDMIPELSSSHSEEGGSHWHCILQALGLLTGLGIMLVIALYEHDLKTIFDDES
ncbi:zinc transporter foi-like [Leptopilina boulardi]|uniref:zinc transporter foi-like n=1 Tax=Leptopilina boulardi TaxID=63433 RepID=UPI0021F5724B|nr:zinc transporter foi-like [Leptopilina boulardi]XP_051174556.1 zinc transporter foi-like [Leptopilina boulardi]